MKDITRAILLCILAVSLNFMTGYLFLDIFHIPLFMDTIFTVAIVFYCGLIPGLCVALSYNIIATFTLVIRGFTFEPYPMLFGISGALIALSTWFFARQKEEFRISTSVTLIYLVLIAVISSFCSIISSGIIDYVRYTVANLPDRVGPVRAFTEAFVNQKFSLFAACILGQIPSSITDRLITTFLGFGVYKLMVRVLGEEKW